jgi:hypothetical protein
VRSRERGRERGRESKGTGRERRERTRKRERESSEWGGGNGQVVVVRACTQGREADMRDRNERDVCTHEGVVCQTADCSGLVIPRV